MPGPTKQPKEIALAKGTYNSTRYPDNMPEWVKCDGLPDPSEHLKEEEAVLWYKTCQELQNNGLLIESYLQLLERYCDARYLYRMNRDIVYAIMEEDGDLRNKHDQIIPEHSAMEKNRKAMLTIEKELGFTPSARGKIDIPKKTESDGFDDL